MSERGSFVTEYIYCGKCFEAAKTVLLGDEKYLCSRVICSWEEGGSLPIIGGKLGGLYSGEELHQMDIGMRDRLEPLLCHDLRIAVLAESGQEIFTFKPKP